MTLRCPNCMGPLPDHPDNACVLNAFIALLRDRGNKTEEELLDLHANCDVDAMWERLGPVIDDLEDGHFNEEM